MRAVFRKAHAYADDALNLPVANVEAAVPYYERTFGFHVVSRHATPHACAILARDDVQIGLVENGGDPTQEGCFFEVDDIDSAFAEIQTNGGKPGAIKSETKGGHTRRVFFVIAPDGLCYMLAEPAV